MEARIADAVSMELRAFERPVQEAVGLAYIISGHRCAVAHFAVRTDHVPRKQPC
jgi:hypothetical protein